MKKPFGYGLLMLFCIGSLFISQVDAATSGISRQDIQDFLKRPGNGMFDPEWTQRYQDKQVHWQGTVYQVDDSEADQPIEVLVKVLQTSHLYDTVLRIPRSHPLARDLKVGAVIDFQGVITGGADTLLLKEVHVTMMNGQSYAHLLQNRHMAISQR